MGNRLSLGASPPSHNYFDEDGASSSFGGEEQLSDSSLEIVDSGGGGRDVNDAFRTESPDSEASPSAPTGRHNLAFAPSLRDISARAAAQTLSSTSNPSSNQRIQSSRPRICPIIQNGRQVTKDFYWVLPERQSRTATAAIVEEKNSDVDEGYRNFPTTPQPPKPPPRRTCHSESSSVQPKTRCRRTTSSTSSTTPSNSSVASAFLPSQWQPSLLRRVQRSAPGATEEECRLALGLNGGDAESAVRFLKVEQLFRLGLAERADCLAALEAANWCLETAGAGLADQLTG